MSDGLDFAPEARWIWSREQEERRPNRFVMFRRSIDVQGVPARATLRVTADSRYELYVNGEWVGHGPPRAWHTPWPVDEYDLTPWLRPGPNVLAVLVQHLGVSTFQYLDAEAGLLGQLDWRDEAGERRVVTDGAWSARRHEAHGWPVPRISCMLGWEEQFDARLDPRDGAGRGWCEPRFDDSAWSAARVAAAPGEGVHERFERRTIPFLTREPTAPRRVLGAEAVRPAPYSWSLNLRELFNPADRSANICIGSMLLVTHVHSEQDQPVSLHSPSGLWWDAEWKLNGDPLAFDDHDALPGDRGLAHARLRAGWNVLLGRPARVAHLLDVALNLWAEHPVRLAGLGDQARGEGSDWVCMGPFAAPSAEAESGTKVETSGRSVVTADPIHPEATAERAQAIWVRGRPTPEELEGPLARPVDARYQAMADLFAVCSSERVVEGLTPHVEDPDALLHEQAEWTVVHPVNGADVRLLVDFGDEVVGHQEVELDAPAGTMLDVHNFEFIQHDGRINICDGMSNTFRYTCREGAQRYRTFNRRGFRYCWLSLRGFDRPVRIRFVRALVCTYPVAGGGDFSCSDSLLTRVWHTGAHTLRCCAEDTYTDCPTYEQTHWVGDARNEALVDLLANGDPRLSAHCWLQAARSLERSALVESQVPSGWRIILPAWSFLWMRWAREHYQLTGDTAFAHQALPWLDRNVRGIEAHLNGQGLFEIDAWNMFDWAPMDTPSEGVVTHQNCLAVLGLRQAAALARQVDDAARAEAWDRLADRIATAVDRLLWDERERAYIDCLHADGTPSTVLSQQTQTAAYIAGVGPAERMARCLELMEDPPAHFVRAGSPFFMFFFLEGLVREGRFPDMLDVIRAYWGQQVDAGATTFWEMYDPDHARHTRSHCHGWSSAPTVFLSQHVLGVQPMEPGYRTIRVAPRPGGLSWAHGRVPTPQGPVAIHWKQRPDRFDLDLWLPEGVAATLSPPVRGVLEVRAGEADGPAADGGEVNVVGPRVSLSISTAADTEPVAAGRDAVE